MNSLLHRDEQWFFPHFKKKCHHSVYTTSHPFNGKETLVLFFLSVLRWALCVYQLDLSPKITSLFTFMSIPVKEVLLFSSDSSIMSYTHPPVQKNTVRFSWHRPCESYLTFVVDEDLSFFSFPIQIIVHLKANTPPTNHSNQLLQRRVKPLQTRRTSALKYHNPCVAGQELHKHVHTAAAHN